MLFEEGLYGPYAVLLPPDICADAQTPLEDSRIRPIDMLPPDVECFESTRALGSSEGLVASLGGNAVDLVKPVDDYQLSFRHRQHTNFFRLKTRLALRVKREHVGVALRFVE